MIRFGTSGWRAIIGDAFTFRNVRLVLQALAEVLNQDPVRRATVVVGYDTRFLSERMAEEATAVLSANGITVLRCARDAPTPAISFAVREHAATAAVYFTASHNPPEYNGLKIFDDTGAPAPASLTERIEQVVVQLEWRGFERQYLADDSRICSIDPQDGYLEHLQRSIRPAPIAAAGLKVVVDPLFGTSREYLEPALRTVGCEVESLHNYVDPYFGGYTPDCRDANLKELRARVRSTGADLGLAADGDGDRFGIVDHNGEVVSSGEVLALLVDHIATDVTTGGRFARSVATSDLIDTVAADHGIAIEETAVGFKHIAPLLIDGQAFGGGEESAGFGLARHLPQKDALLAGLLLIERLAVRGRRLSDHIDQLRRDHPRRFHGRRRLDLTDDRNTAVDRLQHTPPDHLADRRVTRVITTDGLKLLLEGDAWCLWRRSGTEPILRIYAEAATPEDRELLLAAAEQLLTAA